MGRVGNAFCCCFRVPSTSYEIAPECDDDFVILKRKKSTNNDLTEHLIEVHPQSTSQIEIVAARDRKSKELSTQQLPSLPSPRHKDDIEHLLKKK